MRVMVLVKATPKSEQGRMPSRELLQAMGEFNEQLVKAGVMLAGEGLRPSRDGKRMHFAGDKKTVLDGPFAETKELVAGYWLWQVQSVDEAIEWLRRCPNPMPDEEGVIEIRPVYELEDFGSEPTPELGEQQARGATETTRHGERGANGEPKAGTHTIRLHRVLRADPQRVYRAFVDPQAMAKWLPPRGFTGTVHHADARVGGTYRMSFTNLTTGASHAFGGTYTETTPGEMLRYTDRFEDPDLPGEMQVTVRFSAVSCGTELRIEQEGVPAAIPAEMCHLGWQESLQQLADLVEAEVAG